MLSLRRMILVPLIFLITLPAFGASSSSCNVPEAFPQGSQFKETVQVLTDNKSAQVSFDRALLRKWDQSSKLPCAPPFKAFYKKEDKEFTFIAVDHISKPVEPENSDLKIIKNELEKIQPKGVLIESETGGVMPDQAFTPDRVSHCYQGKAFICGETRYSANVAHQLGAAVVGGEPGSQEMNQALSEVLKREDLLAFNSTQKILTLKRQGVPSQQWEKEFNDELKDDIQFTPIEWSYVKFKKWLKDNLNRETSDVDQSWMNPSGTNPIQKIANKVDEIREPFILKASENLVNKYNPSVMVYGTAHFYKQSPSLERAFGPPKFECLKK